MSYDAPCLGHPVARQATLHLHRADVPPPSRVECLDLTLSNSSPAKQIPSVLFIRFDFPSFLLSSPNLLSSTRLLFFLSFSIPITLPFPPPIQDCFEVYFNINIPSRVFASMFPFISSSSDLPCFSSLFLSSSPHFLSSIPPPTLSPRSLHH